MDQPAEESTGALCERCSSHLRFDDLATGCREVVDEQGGQVRLSFADAKVEWRYHQSRDDKCNKLIRLRWHLVDSAPHLPQLSRSSQAGCGFCNSLCLYLRKYLGSSFIRDTYRRRDGPIYLTAYASLFEESVEGLVVEVVFNNFKGDEKIRRLFFPIEASPGCQKWLGAEPARSCGYLTYENTSEICRVLAECTANCHPWEASPFLPTRLIDVGTGPFDLPHLVLSSDFLVTTRTKYAALSYCWGDQEEAGAQLKTETITLEENMKRIPYETMTPAIRDAVELTKAIGLRYIWIDALCIIQDDTADWSYESGQMDRVFHSAFVTFCGLASSSCHESFLQRARVVTIPFQSNLNPAINGDLSVRLQPGVREWSDHSTYSHDSSTSRWGFRAWTYQEEKLSTRLLFFGASRMHFLCGTHQWSEGDEKLSRLGETSILLHDRIASIKRGASPASSLHEVWGSLLDDYCYRNLTHTADRLPAISGLARLVAETLGDQYLAGLWKGDILNTLTWSRALPTASGLKNHLQLIRQREYIAPSWSWAADAGGVFSLHHYSWRAVPECTLLDYDVTTDPQNIFGRVYDGYLQIRGKVAPILSLLQRSGRDNSSPKSTTWTLESEGLYDGVVAYLDWHQLDREEEGVEDLVMLLINHQQHPKYPHDSNLRRKLKALVLYPTENPDEYYRVGSVHSDGLAAHDLMRSWFEGEGMERVCTIL